MDEQTFDSLSGKVARYQRAVDEVRADRHLSDEGKAAKIEELYEKAKADSDEAHAKTASGEARERQRLRERLLGMPSGVSSRDYWDAQEWAAKIRTPEQAQREFDRVTQAGDRLRERALLGVTWERSGQFTAASGWGPLLQSYLDQNPSLLPDFDRLAALESQASQQERFLQKLATVPMKPSEIRYRQHVAKAG